MKAFGLGRLTRDIELKHSQSGTAYMQNSIACDRRFKKDGDPDADFFNIKVFGKTAEAMEKMLHKGSKIFVEGTLQNDSWTDKDGNKKSQTAIMVETWEFAESKGESKTESKADVTDFINIADSVLEELPFS